jgi:C-terminal processing protease CtpA/Prc
MSRVGRRWPAIQLLILALAIPAPMAAQEVPDSTRIAHLATLGRLYNAVRFFHPYLGYLGIQWDQVTAEAAGAVHVADTRESYRNAMVRLLGYLNDPRTRVRDSVDRRPAPPALEPVSSRLVEDSVLLVRLRPAAASDADRFVAAVAALEPEIRSARAVIFDLRADPDEPASTSADFALRQPGISRALLPSPVSAPAERVRMHEGYTPDVPARASSVYRSGWHVPAGAVLAGSDSAQERRVIFVVNAYSELPALAVAARSLGVGRIVGEGEKSRFLGGSVMEFPLGDGLVAELRLGELVNGDGSLVRAVDTVVASAAGRFDPALQTALSLSRQPWIRNPGSAAPPVSVSPVTPEPDASSTPPLGERLVALYRLWGAIAYFHAYPERHLAHWDGQLERFVRRFEVARDSVAYALALAELLAGTRDSHGFLEAPGWTAHVGSAGPPFKARIIEGRPIITRIATDSLAATLRIGDEIVSVDGEPVAERMARLGVYLSASNTVAARRDALALALRGAEGSTARLALRGADGRIRIVHVPRSSRFRPLLHAEREGEVLRILPGNIGYADLDRLPGALVDSMFTLFRDTRAIIFDMRGYPRGTAWEIAPRLATRPGLPAARFSLPIVRRPRGAVVEDMADEEVASRFFQRIPPATGPRYQGRTVMLVDERTQSQAEHTALFFEAANQTRLIGSQTAGTNGDVTNVSLPGNVLAWFTGMGVWHADGRPLQGIGLEPSLKVQATVAGIRAGRDEVLERALGYLRESPAPRQGR